MLTFDCVILIRTIQREGLHTHLLFTCVRQPLMLSLQPSSLSCQPVSMAVDPFLSQEMHATLCKIIPLPLQLSQEKFSMARSESIFGCNLNTECQVTERPPCSECGNISQAFCAAQWPTQANKRTGAIHITIPEISQGSTAYFSNCSCLCLSYSVPSFSLSCHLCLTAERHNKMLKKIQLQFTLLLSWSYTELFIALTQIENIKAQTGLRHLHV